MIKLPIKPLSANGAWKGRRFRSDAYKAFQDHVSLLLPNSIDIPEGQLEIHLEFGFSSAGSDWDNPIKPFQDCLAAKFGFNDNRIKRGIVDVYPVKKGAEYIKFQIKALNR